MSPDTYPHILDLVGRAPIVALRRMSPYPGVRILAKVEYFNPGGSIKDRVAVAMVEAAEASGELTPGKILIEATSGNTGIGLAMVCAVKGYPLRLIMPASASEERKRIMRAFGADIVLTPGRLGTDGAIEEAYRLAREEPQTYVLLDQYNNPACVRAHVQTTAREIWEQTNGQVTHVVSTLGTTGTAMGVADGLKALSSSVRVIGVEPNAGHKIQGLKNMQESYPPGIYDKKRLSRVIRVEDEAAFECARRLAREEGLLVGMSSGAAMAGALNLARELSERGEQGLVVAILPDGGERYLSTSLFAPSDETGVAVTDSVSGAKVCFSQASGPVRLYTLGPSLDDLWDVEAWRRIVLVDALARYLIRAGIEVRAGVGLADWDDRALQAARARSLSREEASLEALAQVRERALELGIQEEVQFLAASSHVQSMLEAGRHLLSRGLAYEKLRSVYFDVERDKGYGLMFPVDPDKLHPGKTVDLADYVKDHPRDFTLFKRASLQDLKRGDVLQTDWGSVRPSWFLQHASLALALGGAPQVVVAGQAHRFPHLDNLRALWAQAWPGAEACAKRAWVICAEVEGGQDSQALVARLDAQGAARRALRLWLLSSSHAKSLSASAQALAMWLRNWRKIQDLAVSLRLHQDPREGVRGEVSQAVLDLKGRLSAAFEDDLGLYRFWPTLFDFCRQANRFLADLSLTGAEARAALAAVMEVDAVLSVLDETLMPLDPGSWPSSLRELVEARESARQGRDFVEADRLRLDIEARGFRLEDGPSGPRLYPSAATGARAI